MTKNKFIMALMCIFMLALIAPVVYAQNNSTPSFGQILTYLQPRPRNGIWDILFVYPIFFLAVVTLFMQSDKEMITTLIMAGVLLVTVVDKLAPFNILDTFGTDDLIFAYPKGLLVFLFHAAMFTLPLIVAGMTKSKKSRGPAILTGVLSGIYMFAFWFVMQRPGSEIENQFSALLGM